MSKKLLIVGNGGAGSQIAAAAAKTKKYAITVVTPFNYQEVSLSVTMAIASGPSDHAKIVFPLVREDGVNYITGATVTELSDSSATLSNGETVDFDVAVLATGQKIPIFMPDPTSENTAEARKGAIAAINKKISSAKTIVIAGGGPIGTEVAADIKIRNTSTSVILVHNEPKVLGMMSWSLPDIATKRLSDIGIDLRLNERVASSTDDSVTLKSGRSINCDLYIPAFAAGGNCTFLPPGSQSDRGYALVDDTFKVKNFTKVFAIGDCSSYDPVKTYVKIEDTLPTLMANVFTTLDGSGAALKVHKKGMMGNFEGPLLVSLGHGHPDGFGLGPDLGTGCIGWTCFVCCCFGMPCSVPAGKGASKMKSDFNATVTPKKGLGMHR